MSTTKATTIEELVDLFDKVHVTRETAQPFYNGYITHPRREDHHELWYDYPAMFLLENHETPSFPAPHLIDQRHVPTADTFAPRSGLELQVVHVMDPKAKDVSAAALEQASSTSPVFTFFTTIDLLAKTVGRSSLAIMPYETGAGVRMRFKVFFDDATELPTETWDFNVDEFAALLTIRRPWVEILADVVYRKSARTFLAAEAYLERRNTAYFDIDRLEFSDRWGSRPARSASELLWSRLRVANTDKEFTRMSFVDGMCLVRLPCGHTVEMLEDELCNADETMCFNAACVHCGEPILQDCDMAEVSAWQMVAEVQAFQESQAAWAEYSLRPSNEKGSITAGVLAEALGGAMRSLTVPGLIESEYMAHHSCEESQAAIRAICMCFKNADDTIEMSPQETATGLKRRVYAALKGTYARDGIAVPLPPGWPQFLNLWITRGVNFAFENVAHSSTQEDIAMTG